MRNFPNPAPVVTFKSPGKNDYRVFVQSTFAVRDGAMVLSARDDAGNVVDIELDARTLDDIHAHLPAEFNG